MELRFSIYILLPSVGLPLYPEIYSFAQYVNNVNVILQDLCVENDGLDPANTASAVWRATYEPSHGPQHLGHKTLPVTLNGKDGKPT